MKTTDFFHGKFKSSVFTLGLDRLRFRTLQSSTELKEEGMEGVDLDKGQGRLKYEIYKELVIKMEG